MKVDSSVVNLMRSQHRHQNTFSLKDFDTMTHSELLEALEKIARSSKEQLIYPNYALTSDNLLKMVLIVSATYTSS